MLYPITVGIVLWNLIALLIGSIFTTPVTALVVGNAWLFLSTLLGVALGKAISRNRLRQETTYCAYPKRYKPYLLPAL